MKKDEATTKSIALVNKEISSELADPAVVRGLLATTFKGLSEGSMRQAIFEGVVRGFKFKDFLEKNVYAIPFSKSYSLVTSIDYARKRGAKAGIIGKSKPVYVMDGKKIISCEVTVKKLISGHIGEFTAEVYFDEYSTGKNLWASKPRTMIAKVAEMHALRMACPEELSQVYAEEELESEAEVTVLPSREPMKPYVIPRAAPAEDDEAGSSQIDPVVLENIEKMEAKRGQSLTEVWDEKENEDEKRKDAAGLRMEIAFLLKKKTGFLVVNKKHEVIEKKIMDTLGVSYIEENYKYIIDELTQLADK